MKRLQLITAATAIATVGLFASPSFAEIQNYTVKLTSDQVVPSPTVQVPPKKLSEGSGTATVTYDTDKKLLSFEITYNGLTGPATSVKFYGPAAAGRIQPPTTAPPIVLYGSITSPIKDDSKRLDLVVTPAIETMLKEGNLYLQIHTSAHPLGEIRGQVLKK